MENLLHEQICILKLFQIIFVRLIETCLFKQMMMFRRKWDKNQLEKFSDPEN